MDKRKSSSYEAGGYVPPISELVIINCGDPVMQVVSWKPDPGGEISPLFEDDDLFDSEQLFYVEEY